MRKLCYFFKAISFTRPSYLYDLLPPLQRFHRNKSCYQPLYCRTEVFKNSILPYTRHSLNNLDPEIRRTHSYVNFRKKLLSFVRPTENKTFGMYNLFSGIRLFNRLRSDYSPLNEHAFRHGFGNTFNPFVPNAPFLYPLKISWNRKVFWCFQGVEKGCIGNEWVNTAQKMKFSSKLRIWSHLLKKSLMKNFIFCAV